jgi:hypothetical protein
MGEEPLSLAHGRRHRSPRLADMDNRALRALAFVVRDDVARNEPTQRSQNGVRKRGRSVHGRGFAQDVQHPAVIAFCQADHSSTIRRMTYGRKARRGE